MFKAVFWYFIVPIGVLYLLFNFAGASGEKVREKEKAKEQAEFEELISTEEGYAAYMVQIKIDLKVDVYTKQVYMKGYVRNKGKKNLKNVRISMTYFTKAQPGESRPEFVDLGPVSAGQHKEIDKLLYNAKSTMIQYDAKVAKVTF